MVMDVSSNNRGAIAAAAVVTAAVGTVTLAAWYQRNNAGTKTKEDEEEFVVLNAFEQASVAQGTAPITTLTWLEPNNTKKDGHSTSSNITIQSVIRSRVKEILQHNPWLTGRFVNQKGDIGWTIRYTRKVEEKVVDKILHIQDNENDSKIHTGTDMNKLNELLLEDDLVLQFRNDQNQPLWRVALVAENHCSSSRRIAVVESLSHAAGDGHTFYELHNMLVGGIPVRSLKGERLMNTNELATTIMGGNTVEASMTTNGGFIFSMIWGVILTKLIDPLVFGKKRYTASSRFFLVDANKINAIKKQHALLDDGNVPFVSTNDIVTSWYLSNSCNENGFMALNWRGRLEGHTNDHAGNYEGLLYYRLPQDATTPSLIRQSISNSFRRAITADIPIQSSKLARGTFAVATNWATFISDTNNFGDSNYHAVAHIPIYNCSEVLPCTLSTCVIFQARPDQVAVLVGGTQQTMEGLSNAPFESDKPISSLFEN